MDWQDYMEYYIKKNESKKQVLCLYYLHQFTVLFFLVACEYVLEMMIFMLIVRAKVVEGITLV
jgi:hypothetical protein